MEFTRDDLTVIIKLGEYMEKDTFKLDDVKAYDMSFYEKSNQNGWDTFDLNRARLQLARMSIKRNQKSVVQKKENIKMLRNKGYAMLSRTLTDKMAKNVEISIHNYVLKNYKREDYQRFYARKIRSIVYNLSFDTFKNDVSSKKYKYSDIPYLRHDQMCPERPHAMMKEYLKKKEIDIQRCKMLLETEKKDSRGLYTCKACRSKATVFQAVQIRSADEPMTIFITCLECDNRWKE